MNSSHCLHWYRAQKFIFSKSFTSLACSKQSFLLSNTEFRFDSKHFNEVRKGNLGKELLKIQVRGSKYFRRRPIEVIESVKGKSIDEYVMHTEAQAVPSVLDDDYETDFSNETQRNKKYQKIPQEENLHSDDSYYSGSNDEIVYQKSSKIQDFDQPFKNKRTNRRAKKNEYDEDEDDYENENEKRVFKGLNIQQYNKTHGLVRNYIELGKSKHFRRKNEFFCVEGWRLLAEGFSVGLKPLAIFFSRSRLFENLIPTVAKSKEELTDILNMYPIYKTPYNVFTTWSTLTTPPGIMAVFSIPKALEIARQQQIENSIPVTVILDEIRDPNNMGSIIRTLVAAGVEKIILTRGCCDIWDMKVLRATCGANFRMPCFTHVSWGTMEGHLPSSPSIFLASASPKEEDGEWQVPEEALPNLREMSIKISEERSSYYIKEDGEKLPVNDSYTDRDHLGLFNGIQFPQYYYNKINFFNFGTQPSSQAVLIIGGETGLSNSARKFALEAGGAQVGIPMLNKIDSLNSAVAIGILVYEMRKQYEELLERENRSTTTN